MVMRVLCNGKTLAFQANDASSILATRSNITLMIHWLDPQRVSWLFGKTVTQTFIG